MFQRGASANNAESMHSLGVLYEKGGNINGARHWYQKALALGYQTARKSLNGLGRSYQTRPPVQNWSRDNPPRVRRQPQRPMTAAEREAQQRALQLMGGVIGTIINKAGRR